MNITFKFKDIIGKISKKQFAKYVLWASVSFIIYVLISWFLRNYSICASYLFDDSTKSNGELAKFAATIAGGILVFYGLFLNARRTKAIELQNEISRDGQVGERFKNAIEHLGSDNHAIILGGIHALHRIANENYSYRPVVFEILCSYIREKTHSIKLEGEDTEEGVNQQSLQWIKPTIIIQTIINVLFKPDESSKYIYANLFADLKGVKCMNADFSKARFDNVDFSNAVLANAQFQNAQFKKARFNYTNLYRANFEYCQLEEFTFYSCKMINANFNHTKNRANFHSCDLSNAAFFESNLTNVKISASILKNAHFELSNLTNTYFFDNQMRGTHFEASILIETDFTDSIVDNAHFEGAASFDFRTGDFSEDVEKRLDEAADLSKINKVKKDMFKNIGILTSDIKANLIVAYFESYATD